MAIPHYKHFEMTLFTMVTYSRSNYLKMIFSLLRIEIISRKKFHPTEILHVYAKLHGPSNHFFAQLLDFSRKTEKINHNKLLGIK